MKRVLRGAMAGVAATVVMSCVLAVGRALGLLQEPPPRQITRNAEAQAGAEPHRMPRSAFNASWIAAHFGYGTGCGVVYTLVRRLLPGGPALSGALFGLLVWAVSYLGYLPALDLYPAPSTDRKSRMSAMIAAHLVFGAVLGRRVNRQ